MVDGIKTGSALSIGLDAGSSVVSGNQRHIVMTRVDVVAGGTSGYASTTKMVDFTTSSRPLLFDCIFDASGSTNPVETRTTPRVLDMSRSYDPAIIDCHVRQGRTLISNVGGGQEGMRIKGCNLVGGLTAFRWLKTGLDTPITGITKATPAVVTSVGHTIANGDRVFISEVLGMVEINDREFTASAVAANVFSLTDTQTGTNINSTAYTTYTSGGTAFQITDTAQQPNLWIHDTQTHTDDIGLDIIGATASQIFNNDIRLNSTVDPPFTDGYGIWMKNCDTCMVAENQFIGASFGGNTEINIFLDANAAVGRIDYCNIINNKHATTSYASAVKVSGASTHTIILNPHITSSSYTKDIDLSGATVGTVFSDYYPGDGLRRKIFESISSTSTREPIRDLYRNSPSPANADFLGAVEFNGNNDSLAKILFAAIEGYIETKTAAAEDGGLNIYGILAGAAVLGLKVNGLGASILPSVAIPANGAAGKGLKFSSTANFGVFFGSGAPTGLTAAQGSLYLRSDGTTVNDRAYINTNGSTTWTALVTVA